MVGGLGLVGLVHSRTAGPNQPHPLFHVSRTWRTC